MCICEADAIILFSQFKETEAQTQLSGPELLTC